MRWRLATWKHRRLVDYWNSFADPLEARARTMKLHPQGRIAEIAEIALAAVFMISEQGRCTLMAPALLSEWERECRHATLIAVAANRHNVPRESSTITKPPDRQNRQPAGVGGVSALSIGTSRCEGCLDNFGIFYKLSLCSTRARIIPLA